MGLVSGSSYQFKGGFATAFKVVFQQFVRAVKLQVAHIAPVDPDVQAASLKLSERKVSLNRRLSAIGKRSILARGNSVIVRSIQRTLIRSGLYMIV